MKYKLNLKNIFNITSLIFTLIAFILIYFKLSSEFAKLNFTKLKFDMLYLIISFSFVTIWFSFLSLSYKYILSIMEEDISLINSMRIIGISTFGRYIPGKIWFTVGRTLLAERLGIPKKKAFAAVLIETVYLVLTGLLFSIIVFYYINNHSAVFLFLFPGLFLLICLISPNLLTKIMNFILIKFKKETLDINFSWINILILNSFYIVMWIGFGLQFFFLLKSVGISSNAFYLISIYPVSWVIGFIVVFLPSGIGIREGVMVILLSNFLTSPQAITISILSRIQMTLSELLFLSTLINSGELWRKK